MTDVQAGVGYTVILFVIIFLAVYMLTGKVRKQMSNGTAWMFGVIFLSTGLACFWQVLILLFK